MADLPIETFALRWFRDGWETNNNNTTNNKVTTTISTCFGLWDDTIIETNEQERYALDIAKDALAVETVLMAGESRFLPPYWFIGRTPANQTFGSKSNVTNRWITKTAQCDFRRGLGRTPANKTIGSKSNVTFGCNIPEREKSKTFSAKHENPTKPSCITIGSLRRSNMLRIV